MSDDEVIDLWKPIKRFDSESLYLSFESSSASSSSQPQSLKEEERTETFKGSCFELILDDNETESEESGSTSYSTIDSVIESRDMRDGSAASDFTAAECGEPFVPQCLVYDFTPKPGDEAVTMKCTAFWTHVFSRPELRQFKEYPSVPVPTEDSDTSTSEELNSKENEDQNTTTQAPCAAKAIKWLEEGKSPITTLPSVKRCQNYCDFYCSYPGDRDATESEAANAGTRKSKQNHGSSALTHGLSTASARSAMGTRSRIGADPSGSSRWKYARETAFKCQNRAQTKQVKAMCKEMDSFDEAHPRNLDPPLHLSLQRVVLRKIKNVDQRFNC